MKSRKPPQKLLRNFHFVVKTHDKLFKIPYFLPLFFVVWSYFYLDYASFTKMKLGKKKSVAIQIPLTTLHFSKYREWFQTTPTIQDYYSFMMKLTKKTIKSLWNQAEILKIGWNYTRFYALFYVKKKVSAKTLLIIFFIVAQFHVKTGEKSTVFLSVSLAS